MHLEYNDAITGYRQKWDELVSIKENSFLQAVKPTALGWKVQDKVEFHDRLMALMPEAEHVWINPLNDRMIAKIYLGKPDTLSWGIRIIKIMERRPGSTDATGLDHLDFYANDASSIESALKKTALKWTQEENGPGYGWTSLWFGDTEAKLKHDTILELGARQLQAAHLDLVASLQ